MRLREAPTLAQQDLAIEQHENVLLQSLEDALLILTPIPPDPDAQFFPSRVTLVSRKQNVSIKTPMSYESILIQSLLASYPNVAAPNVLGPTLRMKWGGSDRKWIDRDEKNEVLTGIPQGADLRLFTSPAVTTDPATAGVITQFGQSVPINLLVPPKTTVQIIVEGFDGTNPPFVDMMLICRGFKNQRARGRFWQS